MKLSSFNILEELNRPGLAALRERFSVRKYKAETLVYSPMEETNQVFVVGRGKLRIFLSYADKEFTLAILGEGQVYTTHTRASVQAMEDCELLIMDTDEFHASLFEHPQLAGVVMTVLGGLLKNSFSIISGLVFKDANRRLVEHLLDMADETETTPVDIELGLTTEQLAQIVGTTRQTVSMLLNDLVRSGDLEKLGRGTYRIPDPARLRAIMQEN